MIKEFSLVAFGLDSHFFEKIKKNFMCQRLMAEKMSGKDVKTENLDELNFKFKVLTTKSHQINNGNGQDQCLIDQSKK